MEMALLKGLLTGMAFGVVLYKVGASRYSRVMGMLTLRDTKVMKFAFFAIATASFWYGLASVAGVAESWHLVPRVMPFIGMAHVVGGVLFGAAMGFAGFCPGTCAVKVGGGSGDKKFTGSFALLGLVIGVVVYSAIKGWLSSSGIVAETSQPITIYGLLGVSYGPLALAWGAMFALISIAVDRFTGEKFFKPSHQKKTALDYIRGEWSWWVSGFLAGTVIVIATAQDGYLGFSGSLLAVVGWGAHLVGYPLEVVPKIQEDIAWRAALILGVFPGGYIASLTALKSAEAAKAPVKRIFSGSALVKAFVGGFGLSLGAMIGGGCTTGAFIAAWPTMSVGSLAMAGTFFVVSMATSNFLYFSKNLDLEAAQLVGDRAYD